MICPTCQREMPENSTKCLSCGHVFQTEGTELAVAGDVTKPYHILRNSSETKIAQEGAGLKSTMVASTGEFNRITKVHMEPPVPSTKVMTEQPPEFTKVHMDTRQLKPIYGWLVVTEGKQPWSQFVVSNEERRYIIGSSEDSDIILQDQDVEIHHASLRLKENKVFLTDLDTTVGTQLQGENISRAEVQDGDEIRVGSAILKFRKL